MRWTRQRFARDGIEGRVERLVSDQQRADERCCSVRRSRVVLTPRRWRQVRGVKSAQPGLDKNISVGDGGKRARSPGRARRKPLKPLRAGTSGDSGVLVVTRVRSTNTKCTRDRGCNGHPAFPTPSLGERFIIGSGALRGEAANVCLMNASTPHSQSSSPAKEPVKDTDLILRSLRSKRLEGWTQRRDSRPSFETRARGALLRMRSEIYSEPRKRAIQDF